MLARLAGLFNYEKTVTTYYSFNELINAFTKNIGIISEVESQHVQAATCGSGNTSIRGCG